MIFPRKFIQAKFFRALIVLVILAFLIFFQPGFIMRPLRLVLVSVTWPVQGVFSSFAFEIRDKINFINSISDLKFDNENLMRENAILVAENAKWQSVSQENDELRKEFELLPRQTFRLQAVEVIGRDATGPGTWLTVNEGTAQGILPGMPVIVFGGVVIGRVTEVFSESSQIMLLTHPESVVNGVTVEGGTQGIVRGEYGLGIIFDMVTQDATLQSSHRLITSGLGGGFPKNLFIGTLQSPRLSSDNLYQQASVISPIDFNTLRYVFIIKNSL